MSAIPVSVETKLKEIAERYQVPLEQILKDYWDFFNDPFVQTDPQFSSDSERHDYCLKVIWVRYASALPTKEYQVIPIGYTDPRTTRQGVLQSRILLLYRDGKELKKASLIAQGERAKIAYEIQPFYAYSVHLAFYNNTFFASPKTVFENPKLTQIDAITLLKKFVGAREIKIAETPYNISRADSSSRFVDEWDLFMVRGIVVRHARGTRPDETEWGLYVLSDDSVPQQPQLTSDGRVIPSRFTVWTPASQVRFDVDSEILAVGNIILNEAKEPQMNAIAVYPIHAKLIAGA